MFSTQGDAQWQTLTFENVSLTEGEHSCSITTLDGSPIGLDAIDIDSMGAVKAYDPFIAKAKTKVSDLKNPGDVIAFEYTAASGAVGTFANIGAATKNPIPVTGTAIS